MPLTDEQLADLVNRGVLSEGTAKQLTPVDMTVPTPSPTSPDADLGGGMSVGPITAGPPHQVAVPWKPDHDTPALAQLQQAGVDVGKIVPSSPPIPAPAVPDYDPSMGDFKVLPPGTKTGTQAKPGSLASDVSQGPAGTVPVHSSLPPIMPARSGGPIPPSLIDKQVKELDRRQQEAEDLEKKKVETLQTEANAKFMQNSILANQAEANNLKYQKDMQQTQANRTQAQAEADQADADAKQRAQAIADRKIDPDRRDIGQKIFGAIAVGLGAFGAALTHTRNSALDIIQASIDSDIEAQRQEIQNAKDSDRALRDISEKRYGRQMSQSEFDAANAMTSYKLALSQVDNLKQQTSLPLDQNAVDQLTLGLQEKLNEQKNGLVDGKFQLLQRQEQARAAAANAAANATAARQKRFQDLVQENMKSGDDLRTAQARALSVVAGGDFGNIPGFKKEGDQKAARELTERQGAFDEADKQVGRMKNDPLLDQLGPLAASAQGGGLATQRMMPESTATVQKVKAFNLILVATAGKTLKDSEGRIPPSTLEQVHQFFIEPGDTKELAQEKLRGFNDFIHEQGRQAGINAPEPNAPPDYSSVGAKPRK